MKCYFALSDDVTNSDIYYSMFVCALESARKNTSLDLHCLYDFRKTYSEYLENDRIYQLLKKYGVTIHLTSIDFEKSLLNVYSDEYLEQIKITKSSLYSRFLRFMLADEEKEDSYVLYADTDVLFLKDFDLSSFSTLPLTVGVCPEFNRNRFFKYFNAGIMLINLDSYKKAKTKLIELLNSNVKAEPECCDQGYLNLIYNQNFERLDNSFNWKPYWGINPKAVILHLHGLKPSIKKEEYVGYQQYISFLLKKNPYARNGWYHYFSLFCDYTSDYVDKKTVLDNLTLTMNAQRPNDYTFMKRIIKKAKKILHL